MDNLTWDSSREIAVLINGKFPNTDVLSLSDAKLLDMMKNVGVMDKLPEISKEERADCLFLIKTALARVIENDGDYNARQGDAWM